VLPGHPAEAVASPTPTSSWVANGDVHAVLEAGGRTYLGGDFDQVGPNTGFGVQLDAATGALPSSFAKVDGHVYVTVPDGSVGGTFTTIGGISRSGLAAVDTATGTVDATWNPAPDTAAATDTIPAKTVSALATADDGRLFVGGSFTQLGGAAANGLGVVSPTG